MELVRAAQDLDTVSVSLPAGMDVVVKVLVAVFLFGVALDTRVADLLVHLRKPWVLVIGVAAQFLLLPVLTLGLCHLLDVRGSVALGMMLVACLPAGNLSNLLTHRARGDVALSISLTTASNIVALVATPALFAFWAGAFGPADDLLRRIELDPVAMALEVGLLIALPFVLGIGVGTRWPAFSARMRRPVDLAVLSLLLLVVLGGLGARWRVILDHLSEVSLAVVVQNAMVLGVGALVALALRLHPAAARAMTLEIAVRNTALGLVVALAYFDQVGGVVIVVAVWALWDVVVGLALATWWRRRPIPGPTGPDLRPTARPGGADG